MTAAPAVLMPQRDELLPGLVASAFQRVRLPPDRAQSLARCAAGGESVGEEAMKAFSLLITLGVAFSSAAAQPTRADLLVTPGWLATHLNDANLVLLHVVDLGPGAGTGGGTVCIHAPSTTIHKIVIGMNTFQPSRMIWS